MNRKYEDKLIELAFGDLTPEEALRLEAQATRDKEAAEALWTYRDMRSSLRAMAEVPDHQLSNERLRDAILARGLQSTEAPAKSSGSRGWIWMPVAAGVMAFALVFLKNGMTPTPPTQIMGQTPVAMNLETPKIEVPPTEPSRATDLSLIQEMSRALVQAAVPAMRSRPVEEESTPAPLRRVRRNDYVARNDRAVLAMSRSLESSDKRATARGKDLPPEVPDEKVVETMAPESNRPIVLIAQEQDADTGAQVATEVQSASNVLVGG